MRRNQLDVKRSRLWVARLKGSLSVEHPIAGDELRAIKRYLASREDNLPWLFVSERGARLTRQAVNYIVRVAGEKAKLGRVWPTCSAIPAAITLPTRALICAACRTTSVTEIPSTPRTTPVLPGIGLRDYGDRLAGFPGYFRFACAEKDKRRSWCGSPLAYRPPGCRGRVWPRHGVWSVVVPIDLFVKGLGVERAGGTGGTGDHQQCNKGGRDGLHGYLSSDPIQPAARAGVSVLFHRLVRAAVTEGTTLTTVREKQTSAFGRCWGLSGPVVNRVKDTEVDPIRSS